MADRARPGFDPAAPSLAVYSSFGAAAAAALSSLAAVVVSTVCLARGAHRTHAILGLVLGLPLTLFFIAGLVIAAIGG